MRNVRSSCRGERQESGCRGGFRGEEHRWAQWRSTAERRRRDAGTQRVRRDSPSGLSCSRYGRPTWGQARRDHLARHPRTLVAGARSRAREWRGGSLCSIAGERTATTVVTTENRREGKARDARPKQLGGKQGEMHSPPLPPISSDVARTAQPCGLSLRTLPVPASLWRRSAVPPPSGQAPAVFSPRRFAG